MTPETCYSTAMKLSQIMEDLVIRGQSCRSQPEAEVSHEDVRLACRALALTVLAVCGGQCAVETARISLDTFGLFAFERYRTPADSETSRETRRQVGVATEWFCALDAAVQSMPQEFTSRSKLQVAMHREVDYWNLLKPDEEQLVVEALAVGYDFL